jgi:hypothetical protein
MPSQMGGCACKAVRYELTAEPVVSGACHCRACQYSAGGGPAYAMLVPRAGVKVTGKPAAWSSTGDSGGKVTREFCGACGTPLWSHNAGNPDILALRPGTLDDPSVFKSGGAIWISAAQPWHPIDPSLPQFPGNPPGPPER